jgi:KDO2-lipid IV(A) lauroyltransferase
MQSRFITAFLFITSLLPLPVAHILGVLAGVMFQWFPNRNKRIAAANIARCFPELDNHQQNSLLRASLVETGKLLMESGILWKSGTNKVLGLIRQVDGEEVLRQAMSGDKGVLLAMPHLGAWELTSLYCAHHYPMTTLYRPPRIAELDNMIRLARQRTGATLVDTGIGGIRQLSRALKQGKVVGILPDQVPARGNGVIAPFFDQPVYTMTLLPRLAASFNSTVIYAYAERLPRGHGFIVKFSTAEKAIQNLSLEDAAAAMNQDIEKLVRICPAQYQWIYRRFRKVRL